MRPAVILLLFHVLGNAQVSFTQNVTCSNLPDVPRAFLSEESKKAEYQEGDIIRFLCETGYVSGLPIRYRCKSGDWDAIYKGPCNLKPCALPEDTPNGYYQLIQGEDFVFGSTIKYFCNQGYQMVSRHDTRTCLLDKWTNHVPICQPLSCDLPPEDDQRIVSGLPDSDNPILPDRFLTFSCKGPGTFLNGSSVLICGKDGQWDSPFPTCEDITCRVPPLHRQLRVIGLSPGNERVNIGRKLQFFCNNQDDLEGPQEIQCLETGQWSDPFPTCSENCKVTNLPDNVHVEGVGRMTQARPGQSLRFHCTKRGHVLHGSAAVQCLANGQWSHPFPTCGVPRGCGPPPPLQNGDIMESVRVQYRHNERVEYICQSYHTMQGSRVKVCSNGDWIGEDVTCLRPCTVDRAVMAPRNIVFRYKDVDKLYAPHGDALYFKCARGRWPVGTTGMHQRCFDGEMTLPLCQ